MKQLNSISLVKNGDKAEAELVKEDYVNNNTKDKIQDSEAAGMSRIEQLLSEMPEKKRNELLKKLESRKQKQRQLDEEGEMCFDVPNNLNSDVASELILGCSGNACKDILLTTMFVPCINPNGTDGRDGCSDNPDRNGFFLTPTKFEDYKIRKCFSEATGFWNFAIEGFVLKPRVILDICPENIKKRNRLIYGIEEITTVHNDKEPCKAKQDFEDKRKMGTSWHRSNAYIAANEVLAHENEHCNDYMNFLEKNREERFDIPFGELQHEYQCIDKIKDKYFDETILFKMKGILVRFLNGVNKEYCEKTGLAYDDLAKDSDKEKKNDEIIQKRPSVQSIISENIRMLKMIYKCE